MEQTLEREFIDEMNFHKRTIVKRLYERMYGDVYKASAKMSDLYLNNHELFEMEYLKAWDILKDEVL